MLHLLHTRSGAESPVQHCRPIKSDPGQWCGWMPGDTFTRKWRVDFAPGCCVLTLPSIIPPPPWAPEGVGQLRLHPTMLGCCQGAMFTDFSSSKVLNKKLLSCRLHRPERVWPLQRSHITSSSLKGVLLKIIILVSF